MQISNYVNELKLINWRSLKWFQGNLKNLTDVNFDKLKKNIVENGFVSPFYVTELDGEFVILDGHHRKKALEVLQTEGHNIPEQLPSVFIDCQNSTKKAGKILLAINAHYAKMTESGITDFLDDMDLDFQDLENFDLPDIKLDVLDGSDDVGDGSDGDNDNISLDKPPLTNENDVWEINNITIECSTSDEKDRVFCDKTILEFIKLNYKAKNDICIKKNNELLDYNWIIEYYEEII